MKIEIRTLQDTARLAQRLAALLKGRGQSRTPRPCGISSRFSL